MKKLLQRIRDKLFSSIYAQLNVLNENTSRNAEQLHILNKNISNICDISERMDSLASISNQNMEKIESIASLNNNYHNQLLLKLFNLFQLSNGLFFANNGLSEHIYYNYISSLDRDKELSFFNEIPLERFCDDMGVYHNIFVAGQLSNLLPKILGYGRSARICAGGGIQKFDDGTILCPISLLPPLMGKSEIFVSTNPYLSFLLIYSENILEEISDNVSEFILLPVEIPVSPISMDWTIGFGSQEKDFDQNREWRWAIDFRINSVITVINNMGKNIKTKLVFDIWFLHGDSELVIMNGLRQIVTISSSSSWQGSIETEFLHGINDLTFIYKGKREKIDSDVRELKFALVNFKIEIIDENQESFSYALIDKADRVIRKRLHDAGFFKVQGKMIANKGFYTKQLPVSSFVAYDSANIDESSAKIISENTQNSGRAYINILYKCFRKN